MSTITLFCASNMGIRCVERYAYRQQKCLWSDFADAVCFEL